MYFQLLLSTQDMGLGTEDPLTFSLNMPGEPKVILRRGRIGELEGFDPRNLLCIVSMKKEPPADVRHLFEKLASGRLVIQEPKLEVPFHSIGDNPNAIAIGPRYIKAVSGVPQPLKSFASELDKELLKYAERTVRVLRWRMKIPGSHNPLHPRLGAKWSFDGESWDDLPLLPDGYALDHFINDIRPPADTHKEIINVVASGGDEPLAHSLLREAWALRNSSPRAHSSLEWLLLRLVSSTISANLFQMPRGW